MGCEQKFKSKMNPQHAGLREIMEIDELPIKAEMYFENEKEFIQIIQSYNREERLMYSMYQCIWGRSAGKHSYQDSSLEQCNWCWLQQKNCICDKIQLFNKSTPFNLVVLLHYHEFRRASNTGKIISASVTPQNFKLYLFNLPSKI